MSSDKPTGADNQQGRLESYLSGFADGEGSFSVGVTRRPDLEHGFQLVPEFRVSQNGERATVLALYQSVLECGAIRQNDRNRPSDQTLVYVVRRRRDLKERVIPFFERNPLLSEKRETFAIFATIVNAMDVGTHQPLGFRAVGEAGLRDERRWPISQMVDRRGDWSPEPSETVRRTLHQDGVKIQSELHGDMQSQAEMT